MSGQAEWNAKYEADERSRADLERASLVGSFRTVLERADPGMRVLEAGSGTGRLSVRLARDAEVEVVGVDSAPRAIELGRCLARDAGPLIGSVGFVEADLYHLPFPDQSFDLVFSDSVIEHLEHPDRALTELRRVLKSGGSLVISVPNRWRPDGWDLYRRLARPPYRQTSFSPPELRKMLEQVGLEPMSFFGDELWLQRNFSMLRDLLRSRHHGRASASNSREAVSRARATSSPLKNAASRLLPGWLHVNIGVVARRI
jgi:SAM-dependent methyltransferase